MGLSTGPTRDEGWEDAVPMRERSSALRDTLVDGFLPDVPDVPEEGMSARI